ncbi:putative Ig domain-containing protein [Larkinella rosea]|uniref:T9SS C-terminal target domain-containing protein n=1 Tax=Larkinella rosea TaxID=2025312 RepID=A0A3P1BAZ4_9BACT|nr:putative Ig domain-containing protein [Larkinella rosea]RRA98121.1 hypothetical protein EHT25_31125 [Larkinella rosea]
MRQHYTFARQPRHVNFRLLGRLLSGLLLLLTGLNAQAQKTWIGTTTNWNTASNWSPAGIPTASDNVVIAASAATQPVLTVSALAGSVEVQSGASLSITSGGKLTLNGSRDFGSGQTTAFYTVGTVTNAGQLVIGNTSAVGRYGLINKGSFSNETGGGIAIDRSTSYGLQNSATTGRQFTNSGHIIIGANTTVGIVGLANAARFDNNPGGVISINRTEWYGLENSYIFNNAAQISIGATVEVGYVGFYNLGSLDNSAGGIITIDRTSKFGMWNTGIVNNAARITIGSIAQAAYWGLYNQTTFNNNPGGVIAIDRTTNLALKNEDNRTIGLSDPSDDIYPYPDRIPQLAGPGIDTYAEFTNKGQIIIGAIEQFGLNGIRNVGNFYNTGCDAYIESYGNVSHWLVRRVNKVNQNFDVYTNFNNSGFIIEYAPCCSGNITYNSGVIRNLNGGYFDVDHNTGLLTTTPGGGPNDGPIVTANPSLTISQGQTTTLTASEALSYRWSTGETTESISVTTPGTYSVTGTVGECSGTTSVVVSERTEAPSVSINPSSATLSCSTPTVSLTANGTGTFRWSTGATTSQISVSTAGTYSVTVTSSDNRTATASVEVSGTTNAPSVSINPSSATLSCISPMVSLTAHGTGSFRWNTGSTNAQISVSTAGTYSVTLTSPGGCTATASVTISGSSEEPVALITPSSATLTCANPSVSLVASGGNTYRWEDNSTSANRTITTAGTYSVTVINGASCSATKSITISGSSEVPVATITPSSATLTCGSPSVSLVASGGTTYRWEDNSTSANRTITTAGTYSVTVTTGGCSASTSVTISGDPTKPPIPNMASSAVIQGAPAVTLTATNCNGIINWNGPGGTSGTGTITVATTTPGSFVYQATCTVSSCTSDPASLTVEVMAPTVIGSFDGFINGADCSTFRGWVWDRNKPNTAISIDILDGAAILATILASEFRQDLLDAGKGNGKHAFFWPIPERLKDGLPHSLSARVTGNSFVLKDSPKTLICQGNLTPESNQPPKPPTPTVLVTPVVAQVGVPFSAMLVAFTDPEGGTLSYELSGLPEGLSLQLPNRIISGTPTQSGIFVLTYQATDPLGASNSVSFPLTVNPASTTTVTGDFEGYLDKLDCGGIRGWVWDRKKPNTPLTVEFYLDGPGTVLGSTVANIYRPDLKDAGKGNGSHAYNFSPPGSVTNGTVVRARVLGSTYELKGSPRAYQCAPARLSAETGSPLQVTVLGNPIRDQLVVEVRGVEGQPLGLQLTDLSGRRVKECQIEQAGAVERQTLSVGSVASGLLVLRVSSGQQSVTLKVLKP